jgi:uncharacterized membrane protein
MAANTYSMEVNAPLRAVYNQWTQRISALDANRTKVVLRLEYEPEDFLEKVGDAIGIPSLQIEEDLKRFLRLYRRARSRNRRLAG